MKKLFTLLFIAATFFGTQAQITYTVIKSDGFETTNGFPTDFTKTGSTAWTTATSPYTGGFWLGSYTDAVVADRTQVVSISANGAYEGTQCLKIDAKDVNFNGTNGNLRIRSIDPAPNMAENIGDWNNYIVSFYAKTETATSGKQLFKNNTQLVTDQWQKFTFYTNYASSVNVKQFAIDLLKQNPNIGYIVYIDKFLIEKTVYPTTNAATEISETGFTANWTLLTGATGYNITIQKQIDATPTWENPGTVINVTNPATNSSIISGLVSNSIYRYKVTATDGTITTPGSPFVQLTTLGSASIKNVITVPVTVENAKIKFSTTAGQKLSIVNTLGQTILEQKTTEGLNTVSVNAKGVVLVRIGNYTTKVIL